jgi:hypothetical protein
MASAPPSLLPLLAPALALPPELVDPEAPAEALSLAEAPDEAILARRRASRAGYDPKIAANNVPSGGWSKPAPASRYASCGHYGS